MRFFSTFCLLLSATLLLTNPLPRSSAQASPPTDTAAKVIEVSAKKYEFSPSPIRVKQGTKVQLRITATDHTHGFKISPYAEGADSKGQAGLLFSSPKECLKIERGQTASLEFVAQTPGTYEFKCCVHCGLHHGSMKGELIVEP